MKWPLSMLVLVSCQLEVRYDGSQFTCEVGDPCPPGFACLDRECTPIGAVIDAGEADAPGVADAAGVDAPPGATCGDGVISGSEQCDDGNGVTTDGCVACSFARCGDGFVRAGVEDCDGAGCNSACLSCGGDRLFRPENGHCYYKVTREDTWVDAEFACAADDAHLVTYGDEAEDDAIYARFVEGQGSSIWISLRRDGGGPWRWTTGEPAVYQEWNTGEPSGSGDCARQGNASSTWSDEDCFSSVQPYVCEIEGWARRPEDNHAYRVVHVFRTGEVAEAHCADLGAHLVSYESDGERQFVADLVFETGRYWQTSSSAGFCQITTFDEDGPPYAVGTVPCPSNIRPFVCEID